MEAQPGTELGGLIVAAKRAKLEDGDPRKRLAMAAVQSESSATRWYNVTIRDGQWECACPAWTRYMPRADCKHIVRVKEVFQVALDPTITDKEMVVFDVGRSHGIRFEAAWCTFVNKHIALRTPAGDAVLLALTLLDSENPSIIWGNIIGIIHDALAEQTP